jgi:hypothetical protein
MDLGKVSPIGLEFTAKIPFMRKLSLQSGNELKNQRYGRMREWFKTKYQEDKQALFRSQSVPTVKAISDDDSFLGEKPAHIYSYSIIKKIPSSFI